mgnify:FL=1
MRKREIFRMLYVIGIWAFGMLAYAQNGSLISGTVVDETGEPLPGVNIVIKGTTSGSVTDIDGKFSLQLYRI